MNFKIYLKQSLRVSTEKYGGLKSNKEIKRHRRKNFHNMSSRNPRNKNKEIVK